MRSMAFVPALCEDETLFSYLARLRLLNALGSPRQALTALFGSRGHIVSADLPCHLEALFERLGSDGPFISVNDIIFRATLAPYYFAFASQPIAPHLEAMRTGSGGALKISLGLVSQRFGASAQFRSCEACAEFLLHQLGYVPWLRRHQLPGVGCCALHGIELEAYPPQSVLTDRQRLFLPPQLVRHGPQRLASEPELALARLSAELLNFWPRPQPQRLAELYETRLRAIGLGRGRGVDWRAAQIQFCDRYDGMHCFTPAIRRAVSGDTGGWMRTICRRSQRAAHPVLHLLLIGWLFGSVTSMMDALRFEQLALPFGAGAKEAWTWSLGELSDTARSCRELALLRGTSVGAVLAARAAVGVPIARRPKKLTPSVRAAISADILKQLSFPEIADRHGISTSTVARTAISLKTRLAQIRVADREAQREAHRATWLNLVWAGGAPATRTQLRQQAPAAYAWLYRHDRSWLMTCGPQPAKRLIRCLKNDWLRYDVDMTALLEARVAGLTGLRSVTSLLRLLGPSDALRSNLWRLPRLSSALQSALQSPV